MAIENTRLPSWLSAPLSRRAALTKSALGIPLAAIALETIGETIIDIAEEGIDFLYLKNISERVSAFLHDVPDEESLLHLCYNRDEVLTFTSNQIKNVHIYKFGDSIELENGIYIESEEENQIGNAEEILTRKMQKKGFDWKCYTYARPGAPSGEDNNGVLSQTQLGNSNLVDKIIQDEEVIIKLGLNGDDWRPLASNLQSLINDKYLLEHYTDFSVMQKYAPQFQNILDKFEAISQAFEANFSKILDKILYINSRRLQEGRSPVRLVVSEPMSYRQLTKLPWADMSKPGDPPGIFDTSSLPPTLRNAFYRITTTIYQKSSQQLQDKRILLDQLQVISLPLLGLERAQFINSKTGHLNEVGMENEKVLLERKMQIVEGTQS